MGGEEEENCTSTFFMLLSLPPYISWRQKSTHVCVFLFSPGDVLVHVMFDLGLIASWFYFATGE